MLSKSNSYAVAYGIFALVLMALYANGAVAQALSGMGIFGQFPDYSVFLALVVLGAIALGMGGQPVAVICVATITSLIVLTVDQSPLVRYLTLGAALFAVGLYGMVVSRNAVRVLMSIELMLNAVNLNLIAFSRYVDPLYVRGQVFAVFILTVAAAEAAVGLAIVLAIYRNTATVNMEKFNILKW